MMKATEDPAELKECMKAFEKREVRLYGGLHLRKRRKPGLGEGRYFDPVVNERWMAWQACWDYLVEAQERRAFEVAFSRQGS